MAAAATPRVFVIRHGETKWSLTGQHTSVTDLPLTANGERRLQLTAASMVGENKLILPERLGRVIVSPRRRTQETAAILFKNAKGLLRTEFITCNDVREWDYGDYEGMKTHEIQELRRKRGLDKDSKWSIWRDGCENGENSEQVKERVDRVIKSIKDYQGEGMEKGECRDVAVIAHGHILRCFAWRWCERPISTNPSLILEAGGVGVLSYEHYNVKEPAIVLGSAFVLDDQTDELRNL